MKIFLLFCIFASLGSCDPQLERHQGRQILDGLTNVALRLLTPHGDNHDGKIRLDDQVHANAHRLQELKTQKIKLMQQGRYNPDVSDYFNVLPVYQATLALDREYVLNGTCFQDMKAIARRVSQDEVTVTVTLAEPVSTFCREAMIINTDSRLFVKDFFFSGTHEVTFDAATTDAESWDLYERGPRVFVYKQSLATATANLATTMVLFEPCLTEGVGDMFAEANLNFLRDNVGIIMEPRPEGVPEVLPIQASLIQNGDTFDIMRLDGLDPMIAWAMGSATGHTAIALWREEQLFLCEANAKSPYWPVNGIQCNFYDDWLEYGRVNDYNVVWAPLNRTLSANFDINAAWEFVDAHLGIDYGWEIVLMGLLDTRHGNEICVDSARTNCIVAEHWEMVGALTEKLADVAARVIKPAMMQRASVDFNAPILEAFYSAFKNDGILPVDLHIIPETDDSIYPTTKFGEPFDSDVSICNVFTCKVLREGGVFDSNYEINCGEFGVSDNYRLKIYEENFERPEICVKWDPENPLCQVLGKYRLRLDSQPGVEPRYNYVEPQPGFANSCPALAPDYLAPIDC